MNINQNAGNTAKTTIIGNIGAAQGSAVNIGLKGEDSSITGDILVSADGEKYSPEGFEDSLTDSSKYIEQVILHNNQDPYTIVLIVPNKDALKDFVRSRQLDPLSIEGKEAMLQKIQDEVNEYRHGKFAGMFPEMWLPKAIAVLPEPFTEQNHMVNSTMKIVRGKVEEYYADRIEYAYTLEGKELLNPRNIEAL